MGRSRTSSNSARIDGQKRVTEQRIRRAAEAIPSGWTGAYELARWCAVVDRYVGGMRLYFDECEPERRATAVVDNNNFLEPTVKIRSASRWTSPVDGGRDRAPASPAR